MTAPESAAVRRSDLVAIVLWWFTLTNIVIAFALGGGAGSGTDHSGEPPASGPGIDAPIGPAGIDMRNFVAAPPIPGRPTREQVDAAIQRGTKAFLDLYVEPALKLAESGGWLDVVVADGSTKRLGPNVYAQCPLYVVVHVAMYQQELGLPRDHPQVQRALRFLISTFDEEKGRWLWSEEGCLHAKGMTVFARFGEKERFEKAWRYALQSEMYRPEAELFTMMQSGAIVQTLGPATRSLSGENAWEHGSPIPDEENTSKFLWALLASGRTVDDPDVARLARRLAQRLANETIPLGSMNTRHVVGRAWSVYEFAHWRFPPADGYRIALGQLRAAGRGEWRLNLMLRILPAFRAEMVRALLEAGERHDELDAIVNGFVHAQDEDGSWRVPHIATLWNFDVPPPKGFKYGTLDGSNTYLVTLGLIAWRDHVLEE